MHKPAIRPHPEPASDTQGAARQGNTIPAQGETQDKAPRLPHERDESADSQAAAASADKTLGRIAQADVARGLVDTDKGPVMDATYAKVKK